MVWGAHFLDRKTALPYEHAESLRKFLNPPKPFAVTRSHVAAVVHGEYIEFASGTGTAKFPGPPPGLRRWGGSEAPPPAPTGNRLHGQVFNQSVRVDTPSNPRLKERSGQRRVEAKILLAEDQKEDIQFASEVLQSYAYRVIEAERGRTSPDDGIRSPKTEMIWGTLLLAPLETVGMRGGAARHTIWNGVAAGFRRSV